MQNSLTTIKEYSFFHKIQLDIIFQYCRIHKPAQFLSCESKEQFYGPTTLDEDRTISKIILRSTVIFLSRCNAFAIRGGANVQKRVIF
jgi:hypothetical protein